MSDALQTFDGEERSLYGGDATLLHTYPADGIHPDTREKVYGTRAEQRLRAGVAMSCTFFRGDIIYKHEKHREFVFYPFLWDSSDPLIKTDLAMHLDLGYKFCQAADWSLSERMILFWEEDSGYLVQHITQGLQPSKHQLMYIPYELYLENESQRNEGLAVADMRANADEQVVIDDYDPTNPQPQRFAPSLTSKKERRTVKLEDFPVGDSEE